LSFKRTPSGHQGVETGGLKDSTPEDFTEWGRDCGPSEAFALEGGQTPQPNFFSPKEFTD